MKSKKKIKINFVDFYNGFDKDNNQFLDILKDRYEVIISDEPDYIIYSCFGYDHLSYNCVRIFYTGECYTPDFNECDYAIGFDRMQFGDRYLRMPLYNLFQYREFYKNILQRNPITEVELRSKKEFCCFVYSNCFADDKRTQFFKLLSQYKIVNSGGRYMNNIGGPVRDKYNFQSKHKFAIAFENTSYPGYCTEKLIEAFAARTIPIYWGDPYVSDDFNTDAFINVHDYESFEDVIRKIIEIDNNEESYLKMINSPVVKKCQNDQDLCDFFYNIMDQDMKDAYRRSFSITSRAQESFKLRHILFEKYIYRYYRKFTNLLFRFSHKTLLLSRKIE